MQHLVIDGYLDGLSIANCNHATNLTLVSVMRTTGYSPGQVLLHWLSAGVILWALLSGFYVSVVDVLPQTKAWVGFVNVSLTALFIPVFAVRVYLVVIHSCVDDATNKTLMDHVACLMHKFIYLVTSVVLVTGVLMMDRAINVFDLILIPQPLEDPTWINRFFTVHIWSCVVLLILVALHISAVIKHEMCGRRILKRMTF
jgi:cytochrome b561